MGAPGRRAEVREVVTAELTALDSGINRRIAQFWTALWFCGWLTQIMKPVLHGLLTWARCEQGSRPSFPGRVNRCRILQVQFGRFRIGAIMAATNRRDSTMGGENCHDSNTGEGRSAPSAAYGPQ
jgi:hypothetical protein